MTRLAYLTLLCATLFAAQARADDDAPEADYQAVRAIYKARRYEAAAHAAEALVARHPDCARCAHLLGKSYGRLAQRANWLAAMDLAKKTCASFERAVALDPENDGALEDLIRYYRAAPGFLGGGADKAEVMEKRLAALKAKQGE